MAPSTTINRHSRWYQKSQVMGETNWMKPNTVIRVCDTAEATPHVKKKNPIIIPLIWCGDCA